MMARSVEVFDFSRQLTSKEARAFESRLGRLTGTFGRSAVAATNRFNAELRASGRADPGLRIRVPFSCLTVPIADMEVSDRRAPRIDLRPPATRIMTSQGIALRLYLTILAAAQATTKPGRRFVNSWPIIGSTQSFGWDDIVATSAVVSGRGETYSSVRDKKARSIRTGLDTLERAGLVELVGEPGKRGRHDNFVVLNDIGRQNAGDPLPYLVPVTNEDCFLVPAGFVINGWLNALEDSEIAVLLMIACGRHRIGPPGVDLDLAEGEVAIPGVDRLRHYGLHRDPYANARKTLEWFGLLEVREVMRHYSDGRGEDGATLLHRMKLIPDGFTANAHEIVPGILRAQLDRHN